MGIKGGKVNRDVSIENWEDHRDVAYGSARVATVEIRKALQVRRVRAGHDEARGVKKSRPKQSKFVLTTWTQRRIDAGKGVLDQQAFLFT